MHSRAGRKVTATTARAGKGGVERTKNRTKKRTALFRKGDNFPRPRDEMVVVGNNGGGEP